MSAAPPDFSRAQRALRRDPVLAALIPQIGPCELGVAGATRHPFIALVRAIVNQQLSVKAGETIYQRVVGMVPRRQLTPAAVAALPVEALQSAGLSRNKASYIHELAARLVAREVRLDDLARLEDEEVMTRLCAIKGIGRWSAEMFLMFQLARPDVLPLDDVGLVRAIRLAYGLDGHVSRADIETLADRWRPWRSVACWYLWASLDQGILAKTATPARATKPAKPTKATKPT